MVVTLVVANVLRSTVVPSGAQLAYNVGIGAAVLGIGWWAGLGRGELGLDPDTLLPGLRYGGIAAGVVIAVIAAGTLLSAADRFYVDERADIGFAELALRALVVIPVGTVLVEELAFRGVLLALARRVTSGPWAAALTAGLFGLWHVMPAWRADGAATAAGTLALTTLFGLGLGWLRTRSGSLVAPMLAHVAANSGALVASWLVR